MRVATLQFCPTPSDLKGNLRRLAAMVITAANNGAKIVVAPELALSGYGMMNRQEAEAMSEIIGDFKPGTSDATTSMNIFHALAKRYDVHIAWGLIEKSSTGALHNAQVLMSPSGAYESYAKVNRFANDFLWSDPGKENPPVMKIKISGKFYKVGLLICRDVRDKASAEWNSFYEPGDADIVCFSCAWGRSAFPATAWMDFTRDNKVTLIVSNRYGSEIPNDFGYGGVCIVYADQRVACEGIVWGKPCIVYADV